MQSGANKNKKRIAVLALQGDFKEHLQAIEAIGASAFPLRKSEDFDAADALIIPGGESTAIAKLSQDNSDPIFDTIKSKISAGLPVYGTCMGSIFLAKDIEESNQGKLACMDVKIRRNAFGSQQDSFAAKISIPCLGEADFFAIFIRAPLITACAANVEVLACLPSEIKPKQMEASNELGSSTSSGIVMARQNNILVSVFHPELTSDWRIHKYFLSMIT
jgi:5'-phosphate synthase pdxT subunit